MVRRRAGAVLLGDCISGWRDTLDGTLSGTLVGAPNGTLTDVVGLTVGHWTDAEAATG